MEEPMPSPTFLLKPAVPNLLAFFLWIINFLLCTLLLLIYWLTLRTHFSILFFPFYNCTLGIWKFLGQGLNPSHSCSNTRYFNPLCQAGDWTSTSAVTWAPTLEFLTHCTMEGTPHFLFIDYTSPHPKTAIYGRYQICYGLLHRRDSGGNKGQTFHCKTIAGDLK